MLRRGLLSLLCACLLGFAGCPKRQAPRSIVVYVPAPAPAVAPPPAPPKVMVIEEPPPPEAQATPTPEPPEPAHISRPRHPSRSGSSTESDKPTTSENPAPTPAAIPSLEPRQSSAQENELRRQFQITGQDFRKRLARLNRSRLSASNQKTLEDAQNFFAQATRALESGDLPRALNLARKAELLLAALE